MSVGKQPKIRKLVDFEIRFPSGDVWVWTIEPAVGDVEVITDEGLTIVRRGATPDAPSPGYITLYKPFAYFARSEREVAEYTPQQQRDLGPTTNKKIAVARKKRVGGDIVH